MSSARSGLSSGCPSCGFSLRMPVTRLVASQVGLYDDGRYPGRVIVSLNSHFEHVDDVPPDELATFFSEVRQVSAAVRRVAPDVRRVNIAILGQKEPHVHAHVIPRRDTDANARVAPWENAEPHRKMEPEIRDAMIRKLVLELYR